MNLSGLRLRGSAADGGELGQIAWKWLEWTTRGDRTAAKTFRSPACSLCKDPAWHISKKRIDGRNVSDRQFGKGGL